MKRKIFMIILILLVVGIYKENKAELIIPKSSIRLRVIPNSNSKIDLNIKEQVKKYLEKDIYNLTNNIDNIEDARNIINNNLNNIDKNIAKIFNDNKYNIDYVINYGENYFPEKKYHGITYQEGYYESLVISIGDAKGDNWWCVLFPDYCLIDNKEKYTYKSYLKEIIEKIF